MRGDEDGYDAEFLSLIEEAEADAIAAAGISKRPKLSVVASGDVSPQENQEGSYMAALRGSRSSLWQRQQSELSLQKKGKGGFGLSSESSGTLPSPTMALGACFKCGNAGHWAKECVGGQGNSIDHRDGLAAAKPCPCGYGNCLVLTSNTPKNPGRMFYRCPLKAENGGCNYFEWRDSPSSGFSFSGIALDGQSNAEVPALRCPCGAGSCVIFVSRSGKNEGQQYYKCPGKKGSGSCGFFKWRNEQGSVSSSSQQLHGICKTSSCQISIDKSYSSCFKCGQEGHWAKDCQNQSSSDSFLSGGKDQVPSTGSGSAPGSCFKCGKSGHWARDCSAQNSSAAAYGIRSSDSSANSHGYNRFS